MCRFALRCCWLMLLFAASEYRVIAQNQVVLDSLNQRIGLLRTLAQAGNFEQGQVEAESFRAFLIRQKLAVPTQVIPTISAIYQANKDSASAFSFLATAERDARLQRRPEARVAMYQSLVTAYERWNQLRGVPSARTATYLPPRILWPPSGLPWKRRRCGVPWILCRLCACWKGTTTRR